MVVGEFTRETDLLVVGGGPGGYTAAFKAAQRGIVLEALGASAWNKTRAARGLGISRQGLIKMMHRLGVPFASPAEGTAG